MLLLDSFKNDIQTILDMNFNYENLSNSTILITGATGLIGSMLCRALSYMEHEKNGI